MDLVVFFYILYIFELIFQVLHSYFPIYTARYLLEVQSACVITLYIRATVSWKGNVTKQLMYIFSHFYI